MLVKDICSAVENLAPLQLAEKWDNCGLLIGSTEAPVSRVLLTLDVTSEAVALADRLGSEMIIAHHPLIFNPLRTLRDEPPINHIIYKCIKNNVSVYAAHTNLDSAVGGVSDALAAVLNLNVIDTLIPKSLPISADLTDETSRGTVNEYLKDFIGASSNVLPGLGRIAVPPEKTRAKPFLRMVNNNLQSTGCIINFDKDKTYRRIAIWGGAFDEMAIPVCIAKQIDCIVAGEIKHNLLLALAESGIHAVAVGHDVTERTVLPRLMQYLKLAIPDCRIAINSGLSYNNLVY